MSGTGRAGACAPAAHASHARVAVPRVPRVRRTTCAPGRVSTRAAPRTRVAPHLSGTRAAIQARRAPHAPRTSPASSTATGPPPTTSTSRALPTCPPPICLSRYFPEPQAGLEARRRHCTSAAARRHASNRLVKSDSPAAGFTGCVYPLRPGNATNQRLC